MTEGIVYIIVGNHLCKELATSIRSIRRNGGQYANAPVHIYTALFDNERLDPVLLDAGRGGPIFISQTGYSLQYNSKRQTHRLLKADLFQDLPFDYNLFLDTDTYCCNPLNGVFGECDLYVRGVPDYWKSANEMAEWCFSGAPNRRATAEDVFGELYMRSKDKPSAWDVGVFPLARRMAEHFGKPYAHWMHSVAEDESLRKAYSRIYDEQAPLNYVLWNLSVPTLDLDPIWNLTKGRAWKWDGPPPRIVQVRVRDNKALALLQRFTSDSLTRGDFR